MRVAISGASGLVGRHLRASLEADGHVVLPLVRSEPGDGQIGWSVLERRIEAEKLEGMDAVVHLAGESIGQRWTAAAKERIRSSRVQGTRLVCEALAGLQDKPTVLVSASAVGFYGDTGQTVVDEDSPAGNNFLAEVGKAWEAETKVAADAGIRVVNLRSGIALSTEHGLLKEQLLPAKLGVLGPVGGGKQWLPWIDLEDLVRAYRFCIDSDLSGPVIGVSPHPVQQAEFARALGRVLGRPAFLPAPGFAMKLAMGEMAQELVLEGQRCDPRVLREAGFEWLRPELDAALKHALDAA